MASWGPFSGVARSRRALTVSLVQLSCRRYQPKGVSRALPWRVARRKSGSLMVAGVRGGGARSGGVWRCRADVDVWVVLDRLGWAWWCRVVPWLRGGWSWGVFGACGGGVLRWVVFWGALVVFWRPVDGGGGRVWGAEQVSGPPGHARHGNG